ncbi:hypothetical protein A2963_02740 [Candidatus Roizmanbacteria bacterium RIFCSPLOWO2_01_FULL_40_13]|nr:MAG: hypothetical protein A2963_02740 [Candidatus Roizmanbacteria bacterium RIFCSPLOWO2_01_FULL_40_13]
MHDISVTIYSLESILYQGKVNAVTSVNEKGKFDILPLHSNFISVIKQFILLHEIKGTKKEFKLKEGVLKFNDNHAHVFLGIEGLKD